MRRFASDDGPMALRCRTNGRDLRDARVLEQIRWELMSKDWTSPLTPPAPPPPKGLTDGKIKELMRLAVNGGRLTFDGRVGSRKSLPKFPCGVAPIPVLLKKKKFLANFSENQARSTPLITRARFLSIFQSESQRGLATSPSS